MKLIKSFLTKLDSFQQSHVILNFPYAVIKKYGDDEAGYQGAQITYYGFLSLFPLLIVLTSTVQILLAYNSSLKTKVIASISRYFPIVGSQLQNNIHGLHKTGLALAVGLVITLYGAKGVADALQHAFNHIWQIPKTERAGFPRATIKSLSIIVFGGLTLLLASVLSSYATAVGRPFLLKLIPSFISLVLLFFILLFIYKVGVSSRNIKPRDLIPAALVATIGIQIVQTFGGYIVTHQLKNLSSLYGTFALVLGILFWIYLQVQIILYALEINTVWVLRLWPRSFTQNPLTAADRLALSGYAKKESIIKKRT